MTIEANTRSRRKRAAAPTTPDPIEIAMEALISGDVEPGGPAHRVLLRHEQLIGWQIMKERAGFALRCLTGIVGVVLAVGIGTMVWEASQERGLVIEPFSVPPEFAEKGITGQVIASRLLDRLSQFSDQTISVRAATTYANNWNGDIKVQIPQTGVSVGELRRYLVQWLGKQTTIGGELYRTPDGLSLIARTGTAPATPQAGVSESDLDAMIEAAAEQVYAATQPYRYAIYLSRKGDEEGERLGEDALRVLTRSGDKADRMWAYSGLNVTMRMKGEPLRAIEESNAALAIEPKFTIAYSNRARARAMMGHLEAQFQDERTALRLLRSDGRRFLAPPLVRTVIYRDEGRLRRLQGDYLGASERLRHALALDPNEESAAGYLLESLAASHDFEAAERQSDRMYAPPSMDDSPVLHAEYMLDIAYAAALVSFHREDWRAVRPPVAQLFASIPDSRKQAYRNSEYPLLAIAVARSGDPARATRIIAGTPTDCYGCVIARGVVAEVAGDRADADRWMAEAIRQGPSLPFAHTERGRIRLARGDIDGAIADFRESHRRGPRWADPLKYWGDALMAQGDASGAIRKYRAAADRAPKWKGLHQAWGAALTGLGRADQARARLAEAAVLA
jgi:tetratricopeptide (TPR) repeat protein